MQDYKHTLVDMYRCMFCYCLSSRFIIAALLNSLISWRKCENSIASYRGVYFRKFNTLLFGGLSLPQTKIRPKHNEGVVWPQNKGHFLTLHPWKPLYRLWILIFLNFFFWVICPIGGTTRNLSLVVGGNIRPWPHSL